MKILSRLINWVKGEPLVVGGALISAGITAAQQARPHSVYEWVACLLPVGLGVVGRFTTVPWAQVKPLADQAAELAAQKWPKTAAWDHLIQSTIDAAGQQVKATGGFPIPIAPAAEVPAPVDPPVAPVA